MRPSVLFVLLSVFTSLVSASKAAKGYQTVAIYYAYSLEWLAQDKNPAYVPALAKPCYGEGDCSTFASFLKANMKEKPYNRAEKTGIFKSGGPFDTNNPGDEAAKAFSNSVLSGFFDNGKMYGPGVPNQEKFSVMAARISDNVDRPRASLGSEGQDIVDKIAHHFEEVVKVRQAELSPNKVADIKKNNPDYDFKTMADNPIEIDWDATLKANPSLQLKDNETKLLKLIKSYNDFDGITQPVHVAAIETATSLVYRLRSPLCG